jgi:hypothetical protein
VRVVALEAYPGDVCLSVVVPVDPHFHRLALPPYGDNPRDVQILAVGVLVGGYETTSDDQSASLTPVAPSAAMTVQQLRLDVQAREAEPLLLAESVNRQRREVGSVGTPAG